MSEAPQNEPAAVPETATSANSANSANSAIAPDVPAPNPAPLSLEELLQKSEAAAQEHRDAFLRAKAETENVRKRAQTELANAHKYAVESFATELVAVKDSLEAALATENVSAENFTNVKNGVELTLKQLKAAFEKFNIAEENPVDQKFDPHRHQAIGMVESDAEANTVVSVLQKGYKLNDRVIRPALVTVAKAKLH